MRLEKFESENIQPLGESEEKKVFINPDDESRVISERKEGKEKDTPRQLKGRFYLTKIAHLLLPKNVPEIYQTGESSDGTQQIEAERISHTPGQTLLQEARRSGEDEESAQDKIIEEMGGEMGELDLELENIGLGLVIHTGVGNYTKDEQGNINYLDTFSPWETNPSNEKGIELLINEEEMRYAIESNPDPTTRETSHQYLDRLLALFEEEKQEQQISKGVELVNSSPVIQELEAVLAPLLEEELLSKLNAIKTEEEAMISEDRKFAMQGLSVVFRKLKTLEKETGVTITKEEYTRWQKKYEILAQATGSINRGVVRHD